MITRMKRGKIAIIISALIIGTGIARASTIDQMDLSKMSEKAATVFYGRCLDSKVIKDEKGIISTLVTYKVIRQVKGEPKDKIIFKVFGEQKYNPGREDVLFLYKESPWGFTAPIGIWQGDFPVVKDRDGGSRLVRESKSYNSVINRNFKASTAKDGQKNIETPDDLLDAVESFIN